MKNRFFALFFALLATTSLFAEYGDYNDSYTQVQPTQVEPSFTFNNEEGFGYILHFKEPIIKHPENVSVILGPAVLFTGNHSWGIYERSFIEIQFEAPADQMGKPVELYMIHLAALVKGKHRNAPIQITINDAIYLPSYDPCSSGWVYDKFDITDWVVEGKNSIRIQLLKGKSAYWLNSLFITFKN